MIIYLAGDMKSGWQDRFAACAKPEWELIDPRTHGFSDPASYTKWDLDGVRRADVVVAFMGPHNPSGFGLSLEVGFAHALGKRVIFVDGLRDDWRTRYFDMHRQISEVVGTLGEACFALTPGQCE